MNDKTAVLESKIAALEQNAREMADHYWRFQGRLNALEITATLGVMNFAKLQPNPFQWVQDYVEAMRVMSRSLIPDTDDPGKRDRVLSETTNAIDEFLEQLVRNAGQLPGAPQR